MPSTDDLLSADRTRHHHAQLALPSGQGALLVTRGPGAGSPIFLSEGVVTIGRDAGATLLLDDVAVSRRHAEIRPVASGYEIVDGGSLNGTYVNGCLIETHRLVDGDELQIGRFKFVFLQAVTERSQRSQ